MSDKLTKKLPKKPGCYLYKNKTGKVIYVGKAINIASRVKSYFVRSANLSPAKQQMLKEIFSLDTIITNNETEALLLETTLIKKYRPKYNVVMKDDKNFTYLKIPNTKFPKPEVVRKIENDKAKYFGPYLSAKSIRQTLRYLNKIFPFCTCERNLENIKKSQICLQYQLGRCLGPAAGKCTALEYQEMIDQLKIFIQGDTDTIKKDLTKKMERASKNKSFELAARYRNRLQDIAKITSPQQAVSIDNKSRDIVSLYQCEEKNIINIFKIRSGKLIDKINLELITKESETDEILNQFIVQYYTNNPNPPQEIVIPQNVKITQTQLQILVGQKIIITVPQKGKLKKLINLGTTNAANYYQQNIPSFGQEKNISQALTDLKTKLVLPKIPKRIEGYDIANIQGQYAVGSMVVFTNGKKDNKSYRHFKIKYTKGINDTAMLAEVLLRRLTNHPNWPVPDLIILDGGKGQLSIVQKTITNIDNKIPIFALAKKLELIYSTNSIQPIKLPRNSEGLKLVQRLRDEAHRFANSYYKKLHSKKHQKSVLDDINGIGPQTKTKLLTKFGSVSSIKQANLEKLTNLVGVKKAHKIRVFLQDN